MATLTFKGTPIRTSGELPRVGSHCPPFCLTGVDLGDLTPENLVGRRVILNIFPSLDTPVCADSVQTFNARAAEPSDTVVLCVSMDLPFAHKRFCGTQGLDRVLPASAFRSPEFGRAFGVLMEDGPLAGLLARAIVALDENGTVVHTQLVPEITQEPDYDLAIGLIRNHHHPCPEDAALTSE
ncbi:MAG: thiol peroxidase [Acidobacteria bacterium]|nr:thiol peroxidase [Acidobacteriota bacterium]